MRDQNKKLFDIPINWALVAALAFFWDYGYYRIASFHYLGVMRNVFISVILDGIFLTFLFLSHYYKSLYKDVLAIRIKDIVAFSSFLIIMLGLSFGELTNPIVGDQIFHAQDTHIYLITIILKLSSMTSVLNNFIFSHVLFLFNLVAIFVIISSYYLFRSRNFIANCILLSLGFLILRVAMIIIFSYNESAFPSLRLFPIWVSSSLLGCTDFSFRLPQFLGIVVFMWLSQRIANHNFPFLCSWFFGLAIGTIPLLWHVGTLVEQSVWTAIIWSIFLLTYANCDDFNNFKWIRWVSLISLFTMLRHTAFLALVPLFVFYVTYNFHGNKYNLKQIFFVLAPVLVMLPFIITTIVTGNSSALYRYGETDWIPKDASSIERVWFALRSGIAPWVVLNSVLLPWAMFPLFAFITYPRDIRKIAKVLVIFIFFTVIFFVFYTIRPCLWGEDRYQAEYIIPFAILGFYYILMKLNRKGMPVTILSIGLICIILYNIFIFKNLNDIYKAQQSYHDVAIRSESVYNYRTALKAVKDSGYAGHTYVAGVTYGVFPEILNRFTVAEVFSTRKLLNKQNKMNVFKKISWTSADPESINSSQEIKLVLVSDASEPQKIIMGLHSFGWKFWKNFRDNHSDTVIYGMIRSEK